MRRHVYQQGRPVTGHRIEEVPVNDAASGGLGLVVARADDPFLRPEALCLGPQQRHQRRLVGGHLR